MVVMGNIEVIRGKSECRGPKQQQFEVSERLLYRQEVACHHVGRGYSGHVRIFPPGLSEFAMLLVLEAGRRLRGRTRRRS